MLGVVLAVLISSLEPLSTLQAARPPAKGKADDPAKLFQRAADLQSAGQLDAAVDAYRAFLAVQPQNVEALSNLGVVFARLGRYDEAIASYRKALEVSYLNVPIRMNLALAYYKAGRCAEAISEFDTVLGSNPGQPNVVLLKGDCLVQMGEYAKAVEVLRPLETTMGPERVFNYVYGMALLQNKQTAEGLAQIDRILRDGDSAEAHLMLGLSHRTAGDLGAARDEFKRALDRKAELPLAHSLYGQALLSTGDREEARRAFETELASNPGDFDANLYLGVILKEDQRLDDARTYFDHALRSRPGDPGVRYQLATVHIGKSENEQALALLEPLVRESPNFIEARVSLATIYYRLKRKEDGDREREAVAELTAQAQARQPGPSNPGASNAGAGSSSPASVPPVQPPSSRP
jgi:tetratricopeptide (TPR) repeat protein